MSSLSGGVSSSSRKLSPACLDFLAIYSPQLGGTERTERDQIVFYHSGRLSPRRQAADQDSEADKSSVVDKDEQLRQIGLAQGIVNFARTFSNNEAVDSVETEKHRIVITELETGWWILASVNLTRLPINAANSTKPSPSDIRPTFEYSSREVSPPTLLLRQLLRAHSILLLHHGPSLNELYTRLSRPRFCDLLSQFWTPFAQSWDVMLHGNPAIDIYSGIKLAASGELGIGVGEEEWGSGERAVLEDLVQRTEGLVDMCVARFGNGPGPSMGSDRAIATSHDEGVDGVNVWLGNLDLPGPADGLIFSGVGALSRNSLRSLTVWMEEIYTYGEDAYGVRENPTAGRRRRPRRDTAQSRNQQLETFEQRESVREPHTNITTDIIKSLKNDPRLNDVGCEANIPQPLADSVEDSLRNAIASADAAQTSKTGIDQDDNDRLSTSFTDPEVWVKYLTLGASTWFAKGRQETEKKKTRPLVTDTKSSLPKSRPPSSIEESNAGVKYIRNALLAKSQDTSCGARFLIGLKGDLNEELGKRLSMADDDAGGMNDRLSLRTLHVEVKQSEKSKHEDDNEAVPPKASNKSVYTGSEPEYSTEIKRLRVIVYIHRPFIFILLFEPNEHSLSMTTFFYELHHYLTPLHKSLLASTAPTVVAARLRQALQRINLQHAQAYASNPIVDLVYDPQTLAIHCSIPNIPVPGSFAAEGFRDPITRDFPWTRVEALNVHSQVLNTYADTRYRCGERERTAKTTRGFWLVWMKASAVLMPALPTETYEATKQWTIDRSTANLSHETHSSHYREAILIRRTIDGAASRNGSTVKVGHESGYSWSGWIGRDSSASSGDVAADGTSSRLTEGVGLDARKYVEALLSLNQ